MITNRNSLFLISNLGSEVTKIFSAKKSGNVKMLEVARDKAKSIIRQLKDLPDTKNNLEIDILSDVIEDITSKEQKYDINPEHLESYFYPFAVRLMQM